MSHTQRNILSRTFSTLFPSRTSCLSRRERRLQQLVAARELQNERLSERVRELEEELRMLQSTNRIQQVEIDELSAVIARNLERVKAETRELGFAPAGSTPYRIPHPAQEIASDD